MSDVIWDGPGDALLTANVEGSDIVLYLCDEEDRYAIQSMPVEDFQRWTGTCLAEISLAMERREKEE